MAPTPGNISMTDSGSAAPISSNRVDLFKVMPDVGPGGGGPGGGSKMIGEHSEMEKVCSNAISDFRKKYG
jgi:hypothetical protein